MHVHTYLCTITEINNDILKRIERMRMADPSLVTKRIKWYEEISMEEGKQLLERTLYPFKEVHSCTVYMLILLAHKSLLTELH